MLIQFTITTMKRRSWSLGSRKARSILEIVRESLPQVAADRVRDLPNDFSARDHYKDRVMTHYRSTFHKADIWWIQGYPDDEGSFIVVVEPQVEGDQVPNRVDDLTLKLFKEIEDRLSGKVILKSNRVEYTKVSQVFLIGDPQVTLWVPETIALILVALLFGAWVSVGPRSPSGQGEQSVYSEVLTFLLGVLGSAVAAFLVALVAYVIRLRRAKSERKVVYQDGE